MNHTLTTSLLVALAFARTAHATDAPPPPPQRDVSITFSPLHLVLPVVELTGEYRVMDRLGLALILGGGSATSDADFGGQKLKATVYEVGAQGRFYALGDFRHGLQLGGEVLYMHLSGDVQGVSALASGLAIGPFVGYKYTAGVGFTFDAQLGAQMVGLAAEATDGMDSATQKRSDWIVLLNLNVGWSF